METLGQHAVEVRNSRMIQVELAHRFRVPVTDAFDYITAIENWKEYWPDFVCVKDLPAARWSSPGDTATIVVRLLNRERELNMTLESFQPGVSVTYLSRQKGLPDAYHERYFRSLPEGFEYRLIVAFMPRRGVVGLFDRSLVRKAVTRALSKTIRNLDRVFKQW